MKKPFVLCGIVVFLLVGCSQPMNETLLYPALYHDVLPQKGKYKVLVYTDFNQDQSDEKASPEMRLMEHDDTVQEVMRKYRSPQEAPLYLLIDREGRVLASIQGNHEHDEVYRRLKNALEEEERS